MWLLLACTLGSSEPATPPDVKPLTPPNVSGDPRAHVAQAFGFTMVGAELADVFPERPYRVALFDEDGDRLADRATLDVDRDGALEQTWSKVDGQLFVATGDGEPEPWDGPVPSGLEVEGSG